MVFVGRLLAAFVLLLFLEKAGAWPLQAMAVRPSEATSEDALHHSLEWMVHHAPVIFSGEALMPEEALVHDGSSPAQLRTSALRIRVEAGIQGATTGEILLLRLWPGADLADIRPHQRLFLFLKQPNGAGFTSAAFGGVGELHIGGGDKVDLAPLIFIFQRRVGGAAMRADRCNAERMIADAGTLPCTIAPAPGLKSISASRLTDLLRQIANPPTLRKFPIENDVP